MLIDEIIPFELPSNFEVIDVLSELIYESSLDTAALFYCAGVGVGMSSIFRRTRPLTPKSILVYSLSTHPKHSLALLGAL
jgi:hypothetical protein